jgi:beta-galactosidase
MEASAYYAAIVWGEYHKPYIGVRPVNHVGEKYFFGMWRGTDVVNSWSWKGMEGHPAEIEVFSEGEMIELFHDDVCLGRNLLLNIKQNMKLFINLELSKPSLMMTQADN